MEHYNKMKIVSLSIFLLISTLLLLSGCGGGGGMSGANSQTSTTTLSDWSTTTNPSTVTASGLGYESTQTYDERNNIYVRNDNIVDANNFYLPTVSLTYDASGNITGATLNTGTPTLNASSLSATESVQFYSSTDGTSATYLGLTNPRVLNWKYHSLVSWIHKDGTNLRSGASSVGNRTPDMSVPTTGTGTFSGKSVGFFSPSDGYNESGGTPLIPITPSTYYVEGDVTITADFANRRLNVQQPNDVTMTDIFTGENINSTALKIGMRLQATSTNPNVFNSTLAGTSGVTTKVGATVRVSNEYQLSGTAKAELYGTHASEVGGVFHFIKNVGSKGGSYQGAFGAKR